MAALYCIIPSLAWAGGLEIPDNGTEALGRGGAFVAKADDGTALEYNVAGLARQWGTRLTLDANLLFHDDAFTRAGVYPGDPSDPKTPYAGQPFPTVHDGNNVFFVPFVAVSTDVGGRLKSRIGSFTLAAGLYGPPAVGAHNYGVGAPAAGSTDDPPAKVKLPNGMTAPAPSRYDITKTNLLLAFPTLAVAYQPHRAISFGLAWQVVISSFDIANANITPLGKMSCPIDEYAPCDSYGRVRASGSSFASSSSVFNGTPGQFSPGLSSFGWVFSALAHPTTWLDVGATLRPQIDIRAEGTIHAIPPAGVKPPADANVVVASALPTEARLGARAVKHYPDGAERFDVELDLTWENWSTLKSDHLHGENFNLGMGGQLDVDVLHLYHDTFGVRLGGAYTHRLGDHFRLTGRLGSYIDTAASNNDTTRLDADSGFKLGLTAGLGVAWRGLQLNVAYAYVWSPARDVTDSVTTAVNAFDGTVYKPSDAVVTVGNGHYQPSLMILSVGLTVNFSAFTGSKN